MVDGTFDWLLGILDVVCVTWLLIAVHSTAKNIQTTFTIVSSVASVVLFARPELAANIMLSGGPFQTAGVIVGLPFVVALFLWPWLVDAFHD
ncbi:MAG: hypothetical protein EHM42_06420 [Planctomycetaceae bacterium]|nr:MAG: hypothetical protein EHM42_06420 [Planctomycetaceae bacterium]